MNSILILNHISILSLLLDLMIFLHLELKKLVLQLILIY